MFRQAIRYAITDRSHYGPTESAREDGVLLQAQKLALAGLDFIQLREKDLAPKELLRLARRMLDTLCCEGSRTRLLINAGPDSRADIAVAAGAHGIHLTSGEGQLTPRQARKILRVEEPVISVSCHTLEEVERARDNAADIILFGPVFGKFIAGKLAVPGTGLDLLAEACARAGDIPVLALGGVTLENTAVCLGAGAKGIAAIRLFQ
jgi:thiamine-phosphate pyrophosphorylase